MENRLIKAKISTETAVIFRQIREIRNNSEENNIIFEIAIKEAINTLELLKIDEFLNIEANIKIYSISEDEKNLNINISNENYNSFIQIREKITEIEKLNNQKTRQTDLRVVIYHILKSFLHSIQSSLDDVKVWLDYCDKNILPWEWDFKQCYRDKNPNEKSIEYFLNYKGKNFEDNYNSEFRVTNKLDCDKEAFHLYKVLGWQNKQSDIIRGDTLNTFLTIYNNYIKFMKLELYKNIDEIGEELSEELIEFSELTHTIGNFSVFPYWMNQGRGLSLGDYFDLTLNSLFKFMFSNDNESSNKNWVNFINKYLLQPFVNEDYSPKPFWENHFSTNNMYPNNEDEINQFLKNINQSIKERGKFIIKKICEENNLINYKFYNDHLIDLNNIKFASELWNK